MAELKRCHLAGFENHYPHQLSGGMRQRAALARALAIDPEIILLDEPFSALDAQTKLILQKSFAETIHESGKTTLLITHDLSEAVLMSDRILVLSERPGPVVAEITVDRVEGDQAFLSSGPAAGTEIVTQGAAELYGAETGIK